MKTLYLFVCTALLVFGMNAQAPNIDWETNLGGSETEIAYAISQVLVGGNMKYVVAGRTSSSDGDIGIAFGSNDLWYVFLDPATGTFFEDFSLGGSGSERAYGINVASDNGLLFAGYTNSTDGDVGGNNGGDDIWVVKLEADPLAVGEFDGGFISIYPNPATKHFTVETGALEGENCHISVFNLLGQEVFSKRIATGQRISTAFWAPGIYLVKIENAKGGSLVKKLIVE